MCAGGPDYNLHMNRFTRCPSCATVYRVEMGQIEAAGGWLRCGQCQHAFDSTGLVLAWSPEASSGLPKDGVQVFEAATPSSERVAIRDLLHHEDRSLSSTETPSQAGVELMAFADALSTFRPGLDPLAPLPSPVGHMPAAEEQAQIDHLSNDKASGHVRAGQAGRLGWLFAWLLGLSLLAQLSFYQRHAIAAHWPASRPVLEAMCKTLACSIQPLQDLDAMVIDGASLVQRSDDYVLSWTLLNTGNKPLEATALQLTLQDEDKKAVLRRVFLPAETGSPTVLTPGQTWTGDLLIQVEPGMVFSHYRVLSFYP